MIIERPKETEKVNGTLKWVFVYGRRKTGKTFLVNNFVKYDEYFFVKTDRNILTKNSESISYETFIQVLKRELENGRTVVVDEFNRLESGFFDFLHCMKKQGKLILISSTLFLSKKLVTGKSSLLGLFAEIPVGIISIEDTLHSLKKFGMPSKEKLELAILLREPIAVDYFDEKKKARAILAEVVSGSARAIPAMIGEIFSEEERELSSVYEGILRSIAVGKVNSGEISSYLFSKRLIKKDDPSMIQQYLGNLISFGIIRRIGVFGRKRFVYKLASPLAKVFYYADERHNISERKVTEQELGSIIDELMPRIVEDSVREFFAEKHGLKESIVEAADYDIDGCLLKFGKPEIALEVKWKKLAAADIRRSEENLSKIDAKRRILFVPDKKGIKSVLEVMDVEDLIG